MLTPVDFLEEVIRAQKRREVRGIASVCSAHPFVLKTAIRRAARAGDCVLVESTCNQVNQYGGYTGMTPAGFAGYLRGLTREEGLPADRLLLGGDHLGPSVWQGRPAAAAMEEAETLVRQCVEAGYVKVHLDTSMRLADDNPSQPLDVEISARRAATLARAAEGAHAARPESPAPRYVIGTEVPLPGGSVGRTNQVEVTSVADVRQTINASREAFDAEGLQAAWERVVAVVVQPGVEFGDGFVLTYDPQASDALSTFIASEPHLVYEAHSTDYQQPAALEALVRDHFAVLKVGPALTFAFREGVFALAMIEDELLTGSRMSERSRIIEVLDAAMCRVPQHWAGHYRGTPEEVARARKYSLSDRSRYYWNDEGVRRALEQMIGNLKARQIPMTLLSQFLPVQYARIREEAIDSAPQALLMDRIGQVLEGYAAACGRT